MDCTAVAENLVAFHVGAIEDADREAIEAHLVGCRACLETYMAIKRAADRAVIERPRPEVRDRLRMEVRAAFPPRSERKPARVAFFRRRIPLYQSVALAAVAAAITLAAPSVMRRVQRSNAPPAPMVDTSRTHAESLTLF
ncbi:MAG: zf-HC2 domain-containing protein [Labilithrix sp.]